MRNSLKNDFKHPSGDFFSLDIHPAASNLFNALYVVLECLA